MILLLGSFFEAPLWAQEPLPPLPINHFGSYDNAKTYFLRYQHFPFPAMANPQRRPVDPYHENLALNFKKLTSEILFRRFIETDAKDPSISLLNFVKEMHLASASDLLSRQLALNALAGLIHQALENMTFSHLKIQGSQLMESESTWHREIIKDNIVILATLSEKTPQYFQLQWEREMGMAFYENLPCLLETPSAEEEDLSKICQEPVRFSKILEAAPGLKNYFPWDQGEKAEVFLP